ncbi:MAG: alpha/beta hydrolase [Gammaproteobacteria bacterium]|nr:alpha/beta hydrolase [Gammaproteobacteria bacterium]
MSETIDTVSTPVTRDRRYAIAEAPRALAELASLLPAAPYLTLAPRGDGHPVLVLPGFGGGDGSTTVIRRYLAGQGLITHTWDLGRNLGSAMPDLQQRLSERLEAVWRAGGQRPVSLVGWSLGGVYARLLTQIHPERVRQVITLGSPIGGTPRPSRAQRVMSRVGATGIDRDEAMRLRRLASDPLPDVPSAPLTSGMDGICSWISRASSRGRWPKTSRYTAATLVSASMPVLSFCWPSVWLSRRHAGRRSNAAAGNTGCTGRERNRHHRSYAICSDRGAVMGRLPRPGGRAGRPAPTPPRTEVQQHPGTGGLSHRWLKPTLAWS